MTRMCWVFITTIYVQLQQFRDNQDKLPLLPRFVYQPKDYQLNKNSHQPPQYLITNQKSKMAAHQREYSLFLSRHLEFLYYACIT